MSEPVQTPASGIDEQARQSGQVEVLSEQQCWSLLAGADVGRLAVAVSGDVDIFPVNFVVHDGSVMIRTAEGTKLLEVVIAGRVAFEADGYDPEHGQAWSVVCKGSADHLKSFDEIYQAQELPLFPWNHSPKEQFIRIRPDRVSGRRFTVYRP